MAIKVLVFAVLVVCFVLISGFFSNGNGGDYSV